jgi:hypothetical protein
MEEEEEEEEEEEDDDDDGADDEDEVEDIGVIQKEALLSPWLRVLCCLVASSDGLYREFWFSRRSSSSIS